MRRFSAFALSLLLVGGLFFAVYRCICSFPVSQEMTEDIRGIWLSYLDLAMPESKNSRIAFEEKTEEILQNITSMRVNTVFFHARAFSDAFYRSALFPASAFLSGTQGKDPGYDALAVFCRRAQQYGVQVHAWINPFRICSSAEKWSDVSSKNPAKKILTDDDPTNDTAIVRTAGGVYYDPASPAAQALILQGVQEILANYPVQGIHIDDYFYPSQDGSVDKTEYDAYRKQGGKLERDDWRRETIDQWVQKMYQTVKSFGKEKIFSISPAFNVKMNYKTLYADTALWCRGDGYCDWIIPQLYVGFAHETAPFAQTVAEWNAMTDENGVRLLLGLAAYKCGQLDPYAGSGQREWLEHSDILSRQIALGRTCDHVSGFVFYTYSSFFGENTTEFAKKELHFVTFVL